MFWEPSRARGDRVVYSRKAAITQVEKIERKQSAWYLLCEGGEVWLPENQDGRKKKPHDNLFDRLPRLLRGKFFAELVVVQQAGKAGLGDERNIAVSAGIAASVQSGGRTGLYALEWHETQKRPTHYHIRSFHCV
jgi:hypothetical protein